MTPRFKLNCILCLVLSMGLDCWAFAEGSPSHREALWQEFMMHGQQHGEQQPLVETGTNYQAAVNTEEPRFAPGLNAVATDPLGEPNWRVQVLIYDYAQVPVERLAKAAKRAKIIFREAGVELLLVEHTSMQKCSSTPSLDDIDLILRILPRPRATLASKSALGEALPCQFSREGCTASVFYNRVQELIWFGEISSDEVLGHAIAHELGHLLLGSDSHAASGLMQDKWEGRDLRRAAKGDLLFTPEQSEVLRRNVLARTKQKRLSQQVLAASKASRPAW
jgi:hypothetical protein